MALATQTTIAQTTVSTSSLNHMHVYSKSRQLSIDTLVASRAL